MFASKTVDNLLSIVTLTRWNVKVDMLLVICLRSLVFHITWMDCWWVWIWCIF